MSQTRRLRLSGYSSFGLPPSTYAVYDAFARILRRLVVRFLRFARAGSGTTVKRHVPLRASALLEFPLDDGSVSYGNDRSRIDRSASSRARASRVSGDGGPPLSANRP